ncbi:MAG: MalM family protein [Marinobacter sp.]
MTIGALRYLAAPLLAALLLAGCQSAGTPVGEREGYFSWVDEQGRVHYTRIPESRPEAGRSPANGHARSEAAQAQSLEEETEYTLDNFPDGDELAKAGNVRPGQRQPYFTWRDADGNVRVSYFTPDARTDVEKGLIAAPVELTPASVYHRTESHTIEPVAGYDPDAFAILDIEQEAEDKFTAFSRSCCEQLSVRSSQPWQAGREFAVRLAPESSEHDFSSGRSPFQLIALPADASAFVARLRSYAHNGLVVPSLAFLDEDLRPVRLVTDLVLDYTPETWRQRGYLEAWLPVFPDQGERWLIVFTKVQDLQGQTVIETRHGPKAIPHVRFGELGIATFED